MRTMTRSRSHLMWNSRVLILWHFSLGFRNLDRENARESFLKTDGAFSPGYNIWVRTYRTEWMRTKTSWTLFDVTTWYRFSQENPLMSSQIEEPALMPPLQAIPAADKKQFEVSYRHLMLAKSRSKSCAFNFTDWKCILIEKKDFSKRFWMLPVSFKTSSMNVNTAFGRGACKIDSFRKRRLTTTAHSFFWLISPSLVIRSFSPIT